MSSEPFVLRWGIMATGAVAKYFCKDLLTEPLIRQAEDVRHEIVAVASSTSKLRASSFIEEIGLPACTNSYASYADLTADKNIDIIYVATPHSHHFQNAMLALQAGKNVLCEKPFTVTSAQAKILAKFAKASGLFLMEAVWTRFMPLSHQAEEIFTSSRIGTVHRVIADLSRNKQSTTALLDYPESHRMVNKALAGGAVLGLGVYPLSWVFFILYHLQPEGDKEVPLISAAVEQYITVVDEMTSIICHFPSQKAMGIALTALRVGSATDSPDVGDPSVRIQGSGGEVRVFGPAYRPLRYKVIENNAVHENDFVECPIPRDEQREWVNGTFWEADECARCIRDGRLESATMPLRETIVVMETIDLALGQGEVKYSDHITSVDYAKDHPLNVDRS